MSNMFTLGWIWTDPEVSGVRQAERQADSESDAKVAGGLHTRDSERREGQYGREIGTKES